MSNGWRRTLRFDRATVEAGAWLYYGIIFLCIAALALGAWVLVEAIGSPPTPTGAGKGAP